MDYSPANPLVWTLFFGFVVMVWGVVRIFIMLHQDYPEEKSNESD